MRKLAILLTGLFLILSTQPVSANQYDELKGLTLEREMIAMIEKGVIQGYNDGTYRPKDNVTRQQFAAFVQRVLELPLAEPAFKDVNTSGALAGSIGAVEKTGIMRGSLDGNFFPVRNITREEMAITMSRVYIFKGLTVTGDSVRLADEKDFSGDEGREAAKKNVAAKVMNGFTTNAASNEILFKPKDLTMRDQVAAVWDRYYKLMLTVPAPIPPTNPTPPPTNPTPPEPEPDPTPEPTPPPQPVYTVARIVDNQLVKDTKTYANYDAALIAYNFPGIEAIYFGNDVIKVKRGLAYAANTSANTTSIYKNADLTGQLTYVTEGREMQYLGSGPDYAIIQIGGTTGYVSHAAVDLLPIQLVTSRDRYEKSQWGTLTHTIYNHVTKRVEGSYAIGPAPAFMATYTDYYSYDGVHFTNDTGQEIGSFYPYFQFQSIRSKSNYTAEELDAQIMTLLADRQSLNLARYKDATTRSKLIGVGAYAKELEATYRVNALFIIAAAIHEGDYGMSNNSLTHNNMYGIGVFDSNPETVGYDFPQESMLAFVSRYAAGNYGPQTGRYSNGMIPGNKTVGMNVMYASDPHWGSKIAGHMYRFDLALGKRDYNTHQLGMTTASTILNVRTQPVATPDTLLFTYKQKYLGKNDAFGYPVIIVEEAIGADGKVWYKVLSDNNPPSEFGWIHSDFVRKLPRDY